MLLLLLLPLLDRLQVLQVHSQHPGASCKRNIRLTAAAQIITPIVSNKKKKTGRPLLTVWEFNFWIEKVLLDRIAAAMLWQNRITGTFIVLQRRRWSRPNIL